MTDDRDENGDVPDADTPDADAPVATSTRDTATSVSDALTTYRYLRIGMVAIVVFLAVAIVIEWRDAGCWQTAVSSYYFTPVRAVFVGGLLAIGFSLIVIKGSTTTEDIFLNLAGMLAPVVALAPTSDVGSCSSTGTVDPILDDDGQFVPAVAAAVENNLTAAIVTGFVGLGVAALVVVIDRGPAAAGRAALDSVGRLRSPGLFLGSLAALAVLVVTLVAMGAWDGFDEFAHGIAAIVMIAFLGAAALAAGVHRWRSSDPRTRRFRWIYLLVAAVMLVGFVAIYFNQSGWRHAILVLEIVEIGAFAIFWIAQTVEHWNEGLRRA